VADSTILREYLIALGFKVDDDQYRKIQTTIKKTADILGTIGEGVAVAAALVDKYVVQMAGKFDDLYYASIQTKSSIENLNAYSYAARMVGLDGHAAAAGIANMARALRANPMLAGRLQMLGVKSGGDTASAQDSLIHQLAKMPRFRALQLGAQFGQDPDTLNQILDHLGEYDAAAKENRKMYADAGINQSDVGRTSAQFGREMDRLETQMDILKTVLLVRFLPAIHSLVTALSAAAGFLGEHPNLATGGGIAAAIGGTIGLKALSGAVLRSIGKSLGLRGAAAAGGEVLGAEAGAAGIAETGAAGLAATAFPVVLAILALLGIGVAAFEIFKHRKEIDATSDKARNSIIAGLKSGWKAVKGEAGWAGHAIGVEAGGLMASIRRSEGLRLHQYMDQGKRTIGYGHHLLPGENYTTIDAAMADKLLGRDVAKADAVISRLLPGVKLSPGMRDALRDYQFNSGGLGNAHKLLSDLRAGRTDKAASDFALYGGYHDAHGVFHPGGSDAMSKGLLNRRLGDAAMARGVSITQKTDIHVTGTNDPHTVARHTLNGQKRTNSDLARNVAAAAGAF
jgi:GH24 family phage-related lysozyme (muramidase)